MLVGLEVAYFRCCFSYCFIVTFFVRFSLINLIDWGKSFAPFKKKGLLISARGRRLAGPSGR
jgi:hypothetical protein